MASAGGMCLRMGGSPAAAIPIHELGHGQRCIVSNEIRLSGTGGSPLHGIEGIDVSVRCIVNVDAIDQLGSVSHQSQPTRPRPLYQSRDQLIVPGPQIRWGRKATVENLGPLAFKTRCSAMAFVFG